MTKSELVAERRLRRVQIAPEVLIEWLKESSSTSVSVVQHGLPKDSVVVTAFALLGRSMTLTLVIGSETFDPFPAEDDPPTLPPVVFERQGEVEELRLQLEGALLLLGSVAEAIGKAESFDQVANILETIILPDQDGVGLAKELRVLREVDRTSRQLVTVIGRPTSLDHAAALAEIIPLHSQIDELRAGKGNAPA